MTMRVVITNEDPRRTATVTEETFTIGEGPAPTLRVQTLIGPGEQSSFHVHAAKRLIVSEDPGATVAQ